MTKTKPPAVQPTPLFWTPFAVIGVVGALLGASVTYLALRPSLQQASPAVSPATVPVDSTSHLPSPELTTGQNPAEADRTLGNFYYDHQNWPEAIKHYRSAISLGLDDANIRTDLGNAYRFTGRADDALAEYRHAQTQDPTHEFSLFNQGGLYLEDLKQPDKAVEIWNQYLVRFPNGRNAAAARQLIIQAKSGAAGMASPATATAGNSSATEDLILKQIKSKQTGK